MPIITMTTGREQFPGRSAQVNVTYIPGNKFGGREESMLLASRGAVGGLTIRRTSHSATPAGIGMKPSVVGEWETATYDVPEGVTLKLWAQQQIGVANMALALLEVRAKAPLYRISVDLTGYVRASTPVAHIEGRFDILTLEQARAAGIIPTPMITKFLTTESKPWFRITQTEPEIEPKAIRRARVVENLDGSKVVVTERRSRRRLAL